MGKNMDMSIVILGVSWAETFVGLLFFSLRFINNWRLLHRFRLDFALAAFTVAIEISAQVFLQLSVNAGMGHHTSELSPPNIVVALKWGWVFQLLAIAASVVGKLAIIAFLIQVRGRHERKPWFLWILAALIIAINITVFGTILGQCKPLQKLWDDSMPGSCDPGREVNQNYSFFQASFNSFSDAALATYPITLFWKLQMKLRLKVALCVLMGMGWIAAACSAVKTAELQSLTKTKDITYDLSNLLIWASTEAWIIVIVGCVPPVRPLIERLLQKAGLTKKSSTGPRTSNPSYDFGTGKNTAGAQHSQVRSHVYGGRADDLDWLEMAGADGSKEEIIAGGRGVMVTTDLDMVYADRGRTRSSDSDVTATEANADAVGRPEAAKMW